ncbi:putative surface antigen D15 [Helianthus anomalus]
MIFLLKNSRTPGTLVHGPHGNQPNNSSPTITRVTSGIEYSRPFRPKWSGTAGLIFQRAGARDDKGDPMIRDFHNCPLTASGNNHDDMLLAKVESVYTGSSDPSSSLVRHESSIYFHFYSQDQNVAILTHLRRNGLI